MAITTKTKGKIKTYSSSYFDDVRVLRKSKYETDFRDLYRNSTLNVTALQGAFAVKELSLWRMGCIELSDFVSKIPNSQLEFVRTNYMGEDYVDSGEDFEIVANTDSEGFSIRERTREDKRTEKVIASPDG